MTRVKRGFVARRRRNKILKSARGYFLSRSKTFKAAKISVIRALQYAFHGRKIKKRDFRKLWITRINAATKLYGFSYSKFIHGLKLANINLNRNVLAQIAIADPSGFNQLVGIAKSKLSTA
jgi:large subunit ribosomal protein L20